MMATKFTLIAWTARITGACGCPSPQAPSAPASVSASGQLRDWQTLNYDLNLYTKFDLRAATKLFSPAQAIEGMVAPLGIREFGIANQYGGEGPLPSPYRERLVRGTRYRALRTHNARVTRVYDDISLYVNRETALELWWA